MDSNTNIAMMAKDLRSLADQLRCLEAELNSPRAKVLGGRYLLEGEPINIEVLSDFKSALDQTRHSVWALLEALAGYSGFTLEEALQNYRMQRASELLHVLRQQVEFARAPETAAARSFLEEIQIMTELAYRRHMRREKT